MLTGTASHARAYALDLAPLRGGQDLISGMHVLNKQPSLALNLADIVNADNWQPATPSNVSSVLRPSTM